MQIDFKIPLKCVACPRPIVTRHGVYYPKNYVQFKKDCVALLKNTGIAYSKDNFLHIDYTIVKKRIYQMSVKKYGKGRCFKPSRPDLDNYVKAINDCMQEAGVIEDDSQLVSFTAQKMYGAVQEEPVIEISIRVIKQ